MHMNRKPLKTYLVLLLLLLFAFSLYLCITNDSSKHTTTYDDSRNSQIPVANATEDDLLTNIDGSFIESSSESTTSPLQTITTTLQATTTSGTTSSPQIIPTDEVVCWISGYGVRFREAPNKDSEIITELDRGTEIVKIGKCGEWINARYNKMTGYIHSDYISLSPLPNLGNGEVRIVVKKSERVLELWHGSSLIGSYSIGLGWEPMGHKQVEGDGRTPEGEYYVCLRNGNSKFYKSLGVSYPNKTDAAAALEDGRIDQSTYNRIAQAIDHGECPDWYTPMGGNILIHGLGGTSDWTAGCVGVDNDVMDILFDYCPIGTRITILP